MPTETHKTYNSRPITGPEVLIAERLGMTVVNANDLVTMEAV